MGVIGHAKETVTHSCKVRKKTLYIVLIACCLFNRQEEGIDIIRKEGICTVAQRPRKTTETLQQEVSRVDVNGVAGHRTTVRKSATHYSGPGRQHAKAAIRAASSNIKGYCQKCSPTWPPWFIIPRTQRGNY